MSSSNRVTQALAVVASVVSGMAGAGQSRVNSEQDVDPGAAVLAGEHSTVEALEENQKRRATRALDDGVGTIATAIASVLPRRVDASGRQC